MAPRKPTKLPLLRSESAAEFLALRDRLHQEIKPTGVIEEIYLDDIAALVWEIQRLRNFRISMIHSALPQAIQAMLERLLYQPVYMESIDTVIKANSLTRGWLEKKDDERKEVAELLRRFNLDESAFEAETLRLAANSLEHLNRGLATAHHQREKSLRMIMDYRASFANRVKHHTDQMLQDNQTQGTITIAHDADQKTAA
jgi:hypothetical protein